MHINPEIIGSQVDSTANLFRATRIINSSLGKKVVVGDFSRVDSSVLADFVHIDRMNYISHCIVGLFSYTGMNTVIVHSQIGAFNSISWGVTIGGANHDYSRIVQHSFLYNDRDGIRSEDEPPAYDRFKDNLIIGNDVWIGANSTITRGVTVGDGAVIGANSLVTKDVPPYAIVGGTPARILKYRFDQEIIDVLLKLKWWNWPVEKIRENYSILKEKPNIDRLNDLITTI